MKTYDRVEEMAYVQGRFYARLRVYTNGDNTIVLASPVFGDAGHLINRRSSWLATHVASVLHLPTTARFFSTYAIDAGDELRTCYHELYFRWIGKIAIETCAIKHVTAGAVSDAIGESVNYLDEVLAKEAK